MKLPQGENALVDLAKLKDSRLSDSHPDEQHKARMFRSALGITSDDAIELQAILKSAASDMEVVEGAIHFYGAQYVIDFELKRNGKVATIRSGWLIRAEETTPRLTTCYVIRRRVLKWTRTNSWPA